VHRRFYRILILTIGLVLAACGSQQPAPEAALEGRILLWHDWDEAQAQVLDRLIREFTIIHPRVTIIQSAIPQDELLERFRTRANLGLGPDLLIGSSDWVAELAEAGLIQDLSDEELDAAVYLSSAIETLRYQGDLYGWPLSLQTLALYYNKSLVSDPPRTLQALLNQAAEGKGLALNLSFESAFWGVQAFGGQLFDQEGRVTLDQGGFANWLGWLKNAREVPNVIFDRNRETLYDLFRAGQVAFYVDGPGVLPELQAALGEDVVSVVPLPEGPNGPAGPFLHTQALMLNTASSKGQTALALRLARFLINIEQQRNLARQASFVPVNLRVRVDPNIYPALAGFVAQSKTAVPKPALPQMAALLRYGNEAYIQALEGEGTAGLTEAAYRLTERVNSEAGFAPTEAVNQPICDLQGRVQVWHGWSEAEEETLQQLARQFTLLCPGVFITLTGMNPDELATAFQEAAAQNSGPDLLIGPNRLITPLATAGLLRDLGQMVDAALWQQYLPAAQNAMRYNGGLYGLPESLHLMALYYNADLVDDPARVLEDLQNQATPDHPVVLPLDFYHAFWGVEAFGGSLFDEEGRLILSADHFASWLSWLQTAQAQPGIRLSPDLAELQASFAQGEAAYFAGPAALLGQLQAALGQDRLRVIPLPAGPGGEAGPFLRVEGLMLNAASQDAQAALALEFAKYLTGVESQARLVEDVNHVPSNINVDVSAYPAIGGFLTQAKTATIVPTIPQMAIVWEAGDRVYADLLAGGITDPLESALGFINFVNETNGFDITAEAPTQPCQDQGQVVLWHSWPAAKRDMLAERVADFALACPDIQVETVFVAADRLLSRLAVADPPPDLFLAPHDWLGILQQDERVQAITPLVDQSTLVQYMPEAVAAVRTDEVLYGLPHNLAVVALYYNADLVDEPVQTVEALLDVAVPESQVLLDSSFYGAAWGVSAFGGQLLDENDQLLLDEDNLAPWLAWLQGAQDQPGFILSPDQAELQAIFAAGEAAYLVAGPDALASLQAQLGEEIVRVAPLPAGPEGEARPFLRVEAFFFSPDLPESQTQLALRLAEFLTAPDNQARFMAEAHLVPVNLAVEVAAGSPIAGFINQIETAVILPATLEAEALNAGDRLYRQALGEPEESTDQP